VTIATRSAATVERLDVSAYEIPVDGPVGTETDGTLELSSTSLVVFEMEAGCQSGLGFSY
jgi:hypothetical protein